MAEIRNRDKEACAFMKAVAKAIEIKLPDILSKFITVGYGIDHNGWEKFSLQLDMPMGERSFGAVLQEEYERIIQGGKQHNTEQQ